MEYFDELADGFTSMLSMGPAVKRKDDVPLCVQQRPNTVDEYGVYATEFITYDEYLGDIDGERKYVWEVIPNDFTLFIDDECIIDMNATPRDICAYVHEDFWEGVDPNCELVRFETCDGELHVGFRTLRPIMAGEELVYRRSQEMWIEYVEPM